MGYLALKLLHIASVVAMAIMVLKPALPGL